MRLLEPFRKLPDCFAVAEETAQKVGLKNSYFVACHLQQLEQRLSFVWESLDVWEVNCEEMLKRLFGHGKLDQRDHPDCIHLPSCQHSPHFTDHLLLKLTDDVIFRTEPCATEHLPAGGFQTIEAIIVAGSVHKQCAVLAAQQVRVLIVEAMRVQSIEMFNRIPAAICESDGGSWNYISDSFTAVCSLHVVEVQVQARSQQYDILFGSNEVQHLAEWPGVVLELYFFLLAVAKDQQTVAQK